MTVLANPFALIHLKKSVDVDAEMNSRVVRNKRINTGGRTE
eukprot:CAMPEP_0184685680 /NCGR_PEP_ID=MMETSP0312-20130426/19786_1 /TAXON_ID=31354 /ORGANISM="Compsopogon coeruleus, Strain SAG 36.94" /LENGTH=40 /DNA_ID= /DNA_START= /DNA_END= /DNA_ORIENTATION=